MLSLSKADILCHLQKVSVYIPTFSLPSLTSKIIYLNVGCQEHILKIIVTINQIFIMVVINLQQNGRKGRSLMWDFLHYDLELYFHKVRTAVFEIITSDSGFRQSVFVKNDLILYPCNQTIVPFSQASIFLAYFLKLQFGQLYIPRTSASRSKIPSTAVLQRGFQYTTSKSHFFAFQLEASLLLSSL